MSRGAAQSHSAARSASSDADDDQQAATTDSGAQDVTNISPQADKELYNSHAQQSHGMSRDYGTHRQSTAPGVETDRHQQGTAVGSSFNQYQQNTAPSSDNDRHYHSTAAGTHDRRDGYHNSLHARKLDAQQAVPMQLDPAEMPMSAASSVQGNRMQQADRMLPPGTG